MENTYLWYTTIYSHADVYDHLFIPLSDTLTVHQLQFHQSMPYHLSFLSIYNMLYLGKNTIPFWDIYVVRNISYTVTVYVFSICIRYHDRYWYHETGHSMRISNISMVVIIRWIFATYISDLYWFMCC